MPRAARTGLLGEVDAGVTGVLLAARAAKRDVANIQAECPQAKRGPRGQWHAEIALLHEWRSERLAAGIAVNIDWLLQEFALFI